MAQKKINRGATHLARVLAVVVLTGGMTATFFASKLSRDRHEKEIRRVFEAECNAMRNAVTRQLDLFFDVLASIGQLHELSDQISAEDFAEFTSKGMQFQKRILSAYGFVQRMPFEIRQAMAEKKDEGLVIVEPDANGKFVSAGNRPEYFPLVYQNPENALAFPTGIDMAVLPGMTEAILGLAARSGPVIASTLRLQNTSGLTGYLALSPLYQSGPEIPAYLSGFTVSILWPQEILDRALADIATRDILIRFFDPEMNPEEPPANFPSANSVIEPLMVADRSWQFEAIMSPEYLQARHSDLPRVILLSGGSITLLLTATIWLLANRTQKIETVVTERTRDLKNANQLLSEAMHNRMRLESEILDISEREKQQVGQDLHDSLGQKLTGAVFLSRALAAHLSGSDAETAGQASRINEILKDSVAQVRRMARGLSPVELGDEGLTGALSRLAEETSSVYSITCLFHHTDNTPVPAAKAAHHIYAIALESVNNAVRHGQAREIVIELTRNDDRGMLTIEDDGDGFEPGESTQRGGMGLRIMQYRATMIDGHVEISRRPNRGMQVVCVFPLA
jgi:signal transduction histidine kinase